MPIYRKTPKQQTQQYLEERIALLRKTIIDRLIYVGEQAFTQAKTMHRYKSQTGNLNSSIGYCILEDGMQVIPAKFELLKPGGEQGVEQGRAFMEKLIAENSRGIVLIMVAGMNYAVYVEAMGLDVLDSAEMLAKRLVPRILKALKFN